MWDLFIIYFVATLNGLVQIALFALTLGVLGVLLGVFGLILTGISKVGGLLWKINKWHS
jgi:hypothetical protein